MTSLPSVHSVLLTGRPGSGKGTQAKRLAAEFGWTHFSTGERFKQLRDGTGPIAAHVKEAYDAGELLPDWFANFLFEEVALSLPEGQGLVCDGYPRTRQQAERFHAVMEWLERPYTVLDLAVEEEEAVSRMKSRALVEDRPDSGTDTQVRARLQVYENHTAPMLDFFREKGVFTELDGMQTPDEVAAAIRASLSV